MFFIDTADVDYIKRTWEKLDKSGVKSDDFIGITTNPNALAKVGCDNLRKFERTVNELRGLIAEIKSTGQPGLLYVQMPYSLMNQQEMILWSKYVAKFNQSDRCYMGLKIPHYNYALVAAENPHIYSLFVNVTGISDSATLLKSLGCPHVYFASIIPGRMHEVGINATEHLRYAATIGINPHQNIIAGSMRTIDGLKESLYYGCIPTIGTRIWDTIDTENRWSEFRSYLDAPMFVPPTEPEATHIPYVTEATRQLSVDFFKQMDELGTPLYDDFISKVTS
jgi:hypothetical protein